MRTRAFPNLISIALLTAIVLVNVIASEVSSAQIVHQQLSYKTPSAQSQLSGLGKTDYKNSALAKLKQLENSKKYSDCATSASQLFKQSKFAAVKGWLMNTWLLCARQQAAPAKGNGNGPRNSKPLVEALASLDKAPELLLLSSAKKSLREESWRARTALIELTMKTEPLVAEAQVLALWNQGAEREQKSKLLGWAGEIASYNHELPAAETLLSESLELADNRPSRERLTSVQLALGEKKTEETAPRPEVLSESENKFEDRFKASLKINDLISFVEDAVSYSQAFPNGRRIKWATDKILEIYFSFFDRVNDEKFASLREKVLSQLEKMDPTRAGDLARILHRRNDYLGSLRLAERALQGLSQSSSASIYLYVAGRSAQFLGDYKKAQSFFERYIESHAAADEINEVYLRLSLVHIRQQAFSSAIATLEKLLLLKGAEKYELPARYWLIRSLQVNKNLRSQEETAKLIEKFPFSYYGLALKAENSNFLLEPLPRFAKLGELEEKLSLTVFQKQGLERALLLANNGWLGEAYQELADLNFPNKGRVKILLARLMSQNKIPWLAIKLTGEALDLDPSLRSSDLLALGFPKEYFEDIKTQATKNKLSPYLVRSLIRQESAFNERATSVSKAMGLMQLIPPTAQEVATELGLAGLDLPEDSYLPEINLQLGSSYIAKMIKQFAGNVPMGLAAYNAGPQKTMLFIKARPEVSQQMTKKSSLPLDEIWIDELPWSESSFYVKAILRNSILFQLLEMTEGQKLQLPNPVWQNLAPDLSLTTRLDIRPDSGVSGGPTEGEK